MTVAIRSSSMDFHHYLQRAKVYRLSDEGRWDDKGTGHVSIEYLERSEAVGLVVIDEEDNATLLVHRISADDIYRKTQDTIIAWTDPEVATDLALSFQETMGCSYIWDQICNVQKTSNLRTVGALDVGPRSENEVLEHLGTSQGNGDTFPNGVGSKVLELPVPELSNLPQIAKVITEASVSILDDRDKISMLILTDPNFLRKLLEVFTICEDLENIEGLHMLHKIGKAIISLNDELVFDIIFSDEFILDIIGILEYDPEVSPRQNHRSFLKEQVIFKEAVPIQDGVILAKIHQTYRLGYIKDVILPNVPDTRTLARINSMILANNVAVVSALQDDNTFIKSFFAELRSSSLSGQAKKDLVRFLQEFCSMSKSLQLPHRMQLFSSLVREGLFDIVTDVLGSDDESLRLSGMDILIAVLNYDPSILRKFLIHQPGHTLFSFLVTGMLTPCQGGVQAQLLEVMRMLLDCEPAERQPPEKSPFLDVFYGTYMDKIMDALTSDTVRGNPDHNKRVGAAYGQIEKPSYVTPEILAILCELLCFCVQHHSYRIKYYVLRNKVMEKVLRLTMRREKYIVVAAVRFFRTCIGRKDEFYNRHVVKNNLFEPVVEAFSANGSRYNLLNSAVLELFDFILKENVKTLIGYIVENYYGKFESIHYVDTFKKLKTRYEQVSEVGISREQDSGAVSSRDKSAAACDRLDGFPDPRRRKDERALDKDEEEYFNEDSDDDEDTTTAQATVPGGKPVQAVIVNGGPLSGSFGLVDYEDEDEDPPGRSNCSERQLDLHSNVWIPPSSANKNAVWLDQEEDKVIQNVKRKSISNVDVKEREEDSVKRQKGSAEIAGQSQPLEEKLSAELQGETERSAFCKEEKGLPSTHEGEC